MDVRLADLAPKERYRLLIGLVIPRPIALITTKGADGVDNAAPFSFFNVMGEDPPIVVVSLEARADGAVKDTTRNILASGEFVVNLVDEALADAMHVCSGDFPAEISEIDRAGLTLRPSVDVAPACIAESPVNLECRVHQTVEMGPRRLIVIGEVVRLHAHDDIVDPATKRIHDGAYKPIGRLYANLYCRTGERFALPSDADRRR